MYLDVGTEWTGDLLSTNVDTLIDNFKHILIGPLEGHAPVVTRMLFSKQMAVYLPITPV